MRRFEARGVALGLMLGCGARPGPAEPRSETPPVSADAAEENQTAPAVPVAVAADPKVPVVIVTDPAALRTLEETGLDFGSVALQQPGSSLADFAASPRWAAVVSTLKRDLDAVARSDPRAGVGMRHVHRLFDHRWLTAAQTRLELVGVVNRIDRRAFHPNTCGEARLVYRLAYQAKNGGTEIDSRLPMTVNVVLFAPDDGADCREAAARWMLPPEASGVRIVKALASTDGPLAPKRRGLQQLKSVEVNMQSVRWPSTIRPDLGGHAGYILRVFHATEDGESLEPAPLENTPDVERLRRSAEDRDALLAWIRDPKTLAALDEGTAVMPESLAAKSAESVTPRGLARLANRPFSQLFSPDDLDGLDLTNFANIGSPRALLRRLDGLSCVGCHQTRSVAGFHLLGEDRADRVVDALGHFGSPHLDGELVRRAEYTTRLADGSIVDETRPLADAERVRGGYGAHCGLGDPGFSRWICREGLTCVSIDDPDFGTCLPKEERGAGDACEIGRIKPNRDPRRDRVVKATSTSCARNGVCQSNRVGFPGGMCSTSCAEATEDEACGLIPALRAFNNCIGRGKPFEGCILDTASPAAMRACDADHPCRDDYICARSRSERGVCMPPYFLFQLRVDGHVL